MADERLRELERRWRETQARGDEVAFLRERRRVLDRSADQLRLDVLEYDPTATRVEIARFLEEQAIRLEARTSPSISDGRQLADELNRLLTLRLGSWFEGLGSGFGAMHPSNWGLFLEERRSAWYETPPSLAGVPRAVDGVMKHLGEVHAFHVKLLTLFDGIPLPVGDAATLEAAARDALRRIVDLVVVETGCDDAWYVKPQRALTLLLADKDVVLPEKLGAELESAFSGSFQSWIAPTAERTEAVAHAVALALVRARFEARYGPS
jgi:hypothetical protein